MKESHVENSIVRYLNNTASTSDIDRLNEWLRDDANSILFKEYIEIHFTTAIGMSDPDPTEIRKRLLKEIRTDRSIFYRKRFRRHVTYAAIAVLFLSVGYFLSNQNSSLGIEKAVSIKNNQITLELDNGETVALMENLPADIPDSKGKKVGSHNGSRLLYEPAFTEVLEYNTLKVPFGKRFIIILSDGTKVHLNAGSMLKYPAQFIKGTERKVFLEGEAFFDVAHTAKTTFKVAAQDLNVQVNGTKFNVSNYSEDSDTEVVLTEGSVSLGYKNRKTEPTDKFYLEPGFKAAFDRTKKHISATKVNTSIYTAWVEGNLVFRKATFEHIARSLERQYDVIIIINNETLAEETFNATIETERETIEEVFDYFGKVYDIDYEFVNDKILIN